MKNKNLDLEIMKVSTNIGNICLGVKLSLFQVVKSTKGLDTILGEYHQKEFALVHLKAIENSFKNSSREGDTLIIDDIEIKIKEIQITLDPKNLNRIVLDILKISRDAYARNVIRDIKFSLKLLFSKICTKLRSLF
jgi:hypothetical protein